MRRISSTCCPARVRTPPRSSAMDIALIAARRPRAERLDLCRARGRGHAHRHALRHRRRHRHVEGSAARRRQRRSDEDAARDRPGRAGRTHRCATSRASWRERRRSPASAIASTTRKIPARRTCDRMSKELGQKAGNTKWFEMSERIEALVKAEKKLYPNVDFYSASTYYTMGIRDRSLHADFRREPHQRLDRPRPGAVRKQPANPPARRLHRTYIPADVDSSGASLITTKFARFAPLTAARGTD